MATLNVKDFPDDLYERLREASARERRSIAQQVVHLLDQALQEERVHSLLELKGLGKELWNDVDAPEHVRRERDAWE